MSFEIECPGCGALSAPSTGVCPFCKSVMTTGSKKDPDGANLAAVRAAYDEGKTGRALQLADLILKSGKRAAEAPAFLVLYAKILLEAESPPHQVRALLLRAQQAGAPEAFELLEVVEAKDQLDASVNDPGEQTLRNLLRRAPTNAYAPYFLGTHLFWQHGVAEEAIRLLERAVALRPSLVKAWGCLLSAYVRTGNLPLAKRALAQFNKLEESPSVRALVKSEMKKHGL